MRRVDDRETVVVMVSLTLVVRVVMMEIERNCGLKGYVGGKINRLGE